MKVKRPELVLAAAVAMSLPMVPGILSGAIDPSAALVRLLIALVVCWVFGGLLGSLLLRYDESARRNEILRVIERSQAHIGVRQAQGGTDGTGSAPDPAG